MSVGLISKCSDGQEKQIGDSTFDADHKQPGAPLSTHRASSPLQFYRKQVGNSCIIHVSLDGDHVNVPKSIVITCHDRAPAGIFKALDEYHLDLEAAKEYKLVQIISPDQKKEI
ncbi:ral guanine nucleotide dissociation stimulator-like isoform X2 [Tamandua tetradactyla]|uniref:ral guanine nucleotide dissociation stimulator-like isoform X2 n=1 Tax=Tamandua tetradactyla TaxID=48850 RepID=UPI00405429AE